MKVLLCFSSANTLKGIAQDVLICHHNAHNIILKSCAYGKQPPFIFTMVMKCVYTHDAQNVPLPYVPPSCTSHTSY